MNSTSLIAAFIAIVSCAAVDTRAADNTKRSDILDASENDNRVPGIRVATDINIGRHFQFLLIEAECLYDFKNTNALVRSIGVGFGMGYSVLAPSVIPISLSVCFGRNYCFEMSVRGLYAYKLQSSERQEHSIEWPRSRSYLSSYGGFLYTPYADGLLFGAGIGFVDDLCSNFNTLEVGIKVGYIF